MQRSEERDEKKWKMHDSEEINKQNPQAKRVGVRGSFKVGGGHGAESANMTGRHFEAKKGNITRHRR